jgi:hypothetical protein
MSLTGTTSAQRMTENSERILKSAALDSMLSRRPPCVGRPDSPMVLRRVRLETPRPIPKYYLALLAQGPPQVTFEFTQAPCPFHEKALPVRRVHGRFVDRLRAILPSALLMSPSIGSVHSEV